MKSQIKKLIIFAIFSFGCNRADSDNSQVDNSKLFQTSNELSHNSLDILLSVENESVNNSKITLSKCKTIYDTNLNPIKYITISNNTSRSINGIEALADKEEERIKIKILLAPKSSRSIRNSLISCSSSLTGIFYADGEYESIASAESILGIKKNKRPNTYRVN
ncbi:hypothetical protein [Hymenobacter psychrophilus]|uniref:hypothetical protein n=1 Tax=Hymenobacter psychrophilus TaxID=651662 RepID=UPI001114895C|nr:hypothetical protein [Hymenobacter psychrophilus]